MVLADFYDASGGGYFHQHYRWSGTINEYDEEWDDIDRDQVEFAMKTAEEDRLLHKDGSTVQIGPQGLKQLHDTGYETNLNEGIQKSILETLLTYKREDASNPRMSRDDLVNEVDEDRQVVDENVWYLYGLHYLEARTAISSTPYHSVEISSVGRKRIQD